MTGACVLGPHSDMLRSCDKEPVHIPGCIQGHGVLLVIDNRDGLVAQAAGDTPGLLGVPLQEAVGRPAARLFATESHSALEELLGMARQRPSAMIRLAPACGAPIRLSATAHVSGTETILELEDASLGKDVGASRLQQFCCEAQDELAASKTFDALAGSVVALVRSLTGFERVMLYKFHHDYSGEVVAEVGDTGLRPLLGHRYPASDIPEPARRLYLKNWLRLISDVNKQQTPLKPASHACARPPLDLTHSRLRAVSPIHIEYLKNMGVCSSLSLTVLVDDKLWGLLACHNYSSPLYFNWEVQRALTLLAQCFSMNLSLLLARAAFESRLAKERLVSALQSRMKGAAPLEKLIRRMSKPLMELVEAGGMALVSHERMWLMGKTPGASAVAAVAQWVARTARGDVHCVSCLGGELAEAKAWTKTASGVLAVGMGGAVDVFILWFRPEMQIEEIWGGNPQAPYTLEPDTGAINPRTSFEAYSRTVKGVSVPWTEHDAHAAACLIPLINMHIIRITEAAVRKSEKQLREKNNLLEHLSATDVLTGVANRRSLLERLEKELTRFKRYGNPLSIAILDIDRFKSVNDTFGHLAGDRVLQGVAAAMAAEVRETDVVGRYGGEEFMVVMPGTPVEGAVVMAERIRSAIERMRLDAVQTSVTASLGVAMYSGDGVLDFISCADSRLYAAKAGGRNRVVYA